MKHIILIIDSLIGGGAEISTSRLATLFLDNNYNVTLISLRNRVDIKIDSRINLIHLNYKNNKLNIFKNIYYAKKLKDILCTIQNKYGKSNLIIGSLGLTHKLMALVNQSNFYYAIHGNTTEAKINNKKGFRKYKKEKEIINLYKNKNIICVSKGVQKDFMSLNINYKSIQTIYNPFDFRKIKEDANKNINLNLPNEFIVHVGRFSKVKRHDILIEAFSLIKNKKIKLLLIGEGQEKENIKKLVKKFTLEDRVIFTGFQKNPYPFIKKANALVLSSDNEGLPTVLIESLILETPICSTNCPFGPKEIMEGEMELFLSEVSNKEDLAKKIDLVIQSNIVITNDMINNYKDTEILKLYEKILKKEII